jgi:mannosyltransferase OCH1-like enzyme
MFWTDKDNDDLVRQHYRQFYEFYQSLFPGIKKAGFARYLYLHRFGGLYVDLDFICLRDLSPLLEGNGMVLGHLSKDNDYYQIPDAFMASCPGHDFWPQIACDARDAPAWERTVEAHTGPLRLQWAYDRYRPEDSIVYDSELIYPLDWIHFTHWGNGRYFREDQVRLAKEIRNMSVEEIATLFPRSYCVTLWTHNWSE